MTLRAIRFIVALLIALGAGLVLVSATGAQAQSGTPPAAPDTAAAAVSAPTVPEVPPAAPVEPEPAAPAPTARATAPAAEFTPVPAQPETAADATSPSQEARQRLEQLRSNEYFYQSYGRNDPFRSLVRGDFEQQAAGELVEIGSARLVGVVWSEEDQFALVEDGAGFGYILRVGDRVRNGTVVAVRRGSLTARVTLYGITSTVVLKLEHTEE